MKTLTLILSILVFTFNLNAAELSLSQLLKFEKEVQTYLNDSSIEIDSAQLEYRGRSLIGDVTFSYQKEFYNPFDIVTFECVGVIVGGGMSIRTLTCREEEPMLWDEF